MTSYRKWVFVFLAIFSLAEGFGQWDSEVSYRSNYLSGRVGDSEHCGIYEFCVGGNPYTLGVVQEGSEFWCYNLTNKNSVWYAGRLKGRFMKTTTNSFFVEWIWGEYAEHIAKCRANWVDGLGFELVDLIQGQSVYMLKTWPLEEAEQADDKSDHEGDWIGYGSGVLFNSMGFVLTNQHVVDGANNVSVVIGNTGQQVEYEAGVVGIDADIDLALLKITDVAFGGVAAPPFSFQTRVSVGEEIFALGYPMVGVLGAEMKYTNGSVSANSGFNGDMKTMQISVPIQKGNSGGPLFNAQGDLIGITNAKIRSDVADNVSYAIKSIFVEAFLGSMPYEVSLPNGSVETENRVDVIDALRPYTCLVLVK